MSKTSNSNWETTVKPIVVLSVISLVVSLLLALVNSMTAPVIAENTKRTTLAAYVVGIRGLTHLSAPSFAFFAGLT